MTLRTNKKPKCFGTDIDLPVKQEHCLVSIYRKGTKHLQALENEEEQPFVKIILENSQSKERLETH